MVDINSSAILVESIKSRLNNEMRRAYQVLMKRLKRAGVVPKKHVLDNKKTESTKNMIQDEYKIQVELVPPGCHRKNAVKMDI